MTRMKKISFLSKQYLALTVLELALWETPERKYIVYCDEVHQEYHIRTTSNDVVDVIIESIPASAYTIEKEIK